MSTTPRNFELRDYEEIAAIFDSLSPEVMRAALGEGWQGFVEDNAPFEPGSSPSPGLFAQWALEYPKIETNLDPDSPPFRDGVVSIYLRLQPGARRGLLLLAAEKIRQAFQSAETSLQFKPTAPLRREGMKDGYWTEQLDIPFFGD